MKRPTTFGGLGFVALVVPAMLIAVKIFSGVS
jgi:hypothetical protein